MIKLKQEHGSRDHKIKHYYSENCIPCTNDTIKKRGYERTMGVVGYRDTRGGEVGTRRKP